jgi:glutaredoxin 2
MGLGFLNKDYESVVLPYNDEATPVAKTSVKMLPILEVNQKAQNESLDILKSLDTKNLLKWQMLEVKKAEIDDLIKRVGDPVHSLCTPYWAWTPEFDSAARAYYQAKREKKRGPFKELIKNKDSFQKELNLILNNDIEPNLQPFYKSQEFSIVDIMIASHLWGMYIFPEFQFGPKMHHYLQTVKTLTKFDYHQDFWK